MYDFLNDDIYTPDFDKTNNCPYFVRKFKCPFYDGYRQKTEEYPIQQQQPPKNPPPNYIPNMPAAAESDLTTTGFDTITPCIFKHTYLWLKNGQSFWLYPVVINRTLVSGWRYRGGQWLYFTVFLNNIKGFVCS